MCNCSSCGRWGFVERLLVRLRWLDYPCLWTDALLLAMEGE